MVSEKRIKELIAESLEMVKQFDAAYKSLKVNDQTILMGDKSELESIAFTVFITQLEEKIEAETGLQFTLDVNEILKDDARAAKKSDIPLDVMAAAISKHLASTPKKA